ncbi:MAG TPA: CYTH and CHAD domain-containing protein [Thermohalobaculum sp.]|nr:CYTH and CHAD domain-containing protein [Thermohalobaculum sp.]
MDEIELKLTLDEAGERRLRTSRTLRAMTRGRATTDRLETLYFDTADWRLRDAGIAFRLRRKNGEWIQTVKAGREMRGGLSHAREVEVALDEPVPAIEKVSDEGLRETIRGAVGNAELASRAETVIRRQKRMLEHGGSLIEFALDSGEVVAGDRSEPLREAEFELIEGDPPALFEAAAAIFDRGPVQFSGDSKGERGYRLATQGTSQLPLRPRKAFSVDLDAAMSTEEALRAILAECLEQITTNAAVVVEADDPEGPHQLRIGLRRLRAALRLVPKSDSPPPFAHLRDEARRLGQAAAAVRDIDVLRGEMLARAGGLPEEGTAALDRALAERAGTARSALRRTLAAAETQSFLFEVASAVAAGVPRRRAGDLGVDLLGRTICDTMGEALDRRWKSVRGHAKGIAGLTVEGRHALRKELKALRYTVEFAEPLWSGGRLKEFLKDLKTLQDVFGSLNDVAMAEAVLMGDDPPAARHGEARLAAGLLIGAERPRAERDWAGAKAAWKALKKDGPFWERPPRGAG